MPHKHKRKRGADDDSIFDLPPTTQAKPLPTHRAKSSQSKNEITKRKNKQQKSHPNGPTGGAYKVDDTPRAFKQLMAFQQRKMNQGHQRHNDPSTNSKTHGNKPAIKVTNNTSTKNKNKTTTMTTGSSQPKIEHASHSQKAGQSSAAGTTEPVQPTSQRPQILPGESLRDFSARVDQLLPLSASAKSSFKNAAPSSRAIARDLGLKERTTRHNKRLQKLIAGWRVEEERLKQRRLEQEEEEQDDEDDDEDGDGVGREAGKLWREAGTAQGNRKGKKLRTQKKRKQQQQQKRSGGVGDEGGEDDDDDDGDPFAAFTKKKLEETRQKNLQDVVQAPPTLALGEKRRIGKVKLKDRSSFQR